MFHKLLPKEKSFFQLFNSQCGIIANGLEHFEEMMSHFERREELMPKIKSIEEEADEAAHRIFKQLNNSFVTPFDREDIQAMVHRLDDVMDLAEKANARMWMYALETPPVGTLEMATVLRRAFHNISSAVDLLDNWKNKFKISELCIEVNRLENKGDVMLREALQKLFQNQTDALYVMKAKEIYEALEEAIDRCEDVANIIETILIKNA